MGAPFVLASSGRPSDEIALDMVRHLPYALGWTIASAAGVPLPKPLGNFHKLFTPEGNPPRPELFVYSDADYLIPPSHVESFIAQRQAAGCTPVQVLGPLRGSPHCGHLRTHPDEYADAVEAFAARVCGGGGGGGETER